MSGKGGKKKATKALTIRFETDELDQVRAAIGERRGTIEGIRKKMEAEGLDTLAATSCLEVLDRCRAAIGDEPDDMFTKKGDPDPTDS